MGWLLTAAALPATLCAATCDNTAPEARPAPTGRYWVFLAEPQRSPEELRQALDEVAGSLTPRSLARRRKVIAGEPPVRLCDLPPAAGQLAALEDAGCTVVRAARYLNAVSVEALPPVIDEIERLEFVREVRPVRALPALQLTVNPERNPPPSADRPAHRTDEPQDYGASWLQSALVNIPAVHNVGYRGRGVLIGLQDTGFDNLGHRCFQHLDIVAAWDFLNNDPNVADEGDIGQGRHGTRTLSVIAGLDTGSFIGAAPEAQFALTKTENTESETPVEEDIWVAGLWFHDSLGVDVLSSSLSYRDWYDYEDLDGMTAVTTRAADSAAAAGMVIVNSMGNTGLQDYPQSKLGAPADGRLVIGAGGVRRDSSYWEASSQGPTYDGRIKPDAAALSAGVYTASNLNDSAYFSHTGTSFSCPMIAGVAALILEANPTLTPQQVADILHETASRHDRPDTLMGYGIPDALAAVRRAEQSAPRLPQPPASPSLALFPNPFNGNLTLVFGSQLSPRQIAVYDLTGRRVLRRASLPPDAASVVIGFDDLAAGTYILRAEFQRLVVSRPVVLLR